MLRDKNQNVSTRRFLFLSCLYLVQCLPQCQHTRDSKEKELVETHQIQLFHTTTKEELDNIKKKGFSWTKAGEFAFSLHYSIAKDYAHFLSCFKKKEAAIIGVQIKESEYKKIFNNGLKTSESISPDKINLISTDIKTKDEVCKDDLRDGNDAFLEKLVNESSDGSVSKFMGCLTKFKGKAVGAKHEFCIVNLPYQTLRNIDTKGTSSTFKNCESEFSGISYGEKGEFCAVTKYYTVLGTELAFRMQEATTFSNCHKKFNGKTFGPSQEFCAVEGYKVLSYVNPNGETITDFSDCEENFKGISFGPKNEYCAIKDET